MPETMPAEQAAPVPFELPEAAEPVYSRTHSDGTEFSGTLEQARELCPVLGKMSVGNAQIILEQESFAAKLAERGREKRLGEAAQATATKPEPAPKVAKPKAGGFPKAAAAPIEKAEKAVTEIEVYNKILLPAPGSAEAPKNVPAEPKQAQSVSHSEVTVLGRSVNYESEPIAVDNPVIRHPAETELLLNGAITEAGVEPIGDAIVEDGLPEESPDENTSASPIVPAEDPKLVVRPVEAIPTAVVRVPGHIDAAPLPNEELPELAAVPPLYFESNEAETGIYEIVQPEQVISEGIFNDADWEKENIALDMPLEPIVTSNEEALAAEILQAALAESGELTALTEDLDAVPGLEDAPPPPPLPFETSQIEESLLDKPEPGVPAVLAFEPAEKRPVSAMPEMSAAPEDIKSAIATLSEVLELNEGGAYECVSKILAQIIVLPGAAGPLAKDIEANEPVAGEPLEELFVELFKTADIEYTPDLIKSFVKLTRAYYAGESGGTLEPEPRKPEDISKLPTEIGTREFLQKLHYGLSGTKKAAANFYEIGRSILRLYTLGLKPRTLASGLAARGN